MRPYTARVRAGRALGLGKSTNTSASTRPNPTKASATPSKAVPTTAPAKTTAPPKPTKAAAPAKAPATTAPANKPAAVQARKQAAAILEKEDQDFRDLLAQGVKVTGTSDFTAWYQKAIVGLDMKQNAFSKADAYFTADTEPTDLIEQWRSDNGDANAAITQYAEVGTSPDAPDAATRKDAADCLAALAKADKDAEKIANGN
ncbi:hypothetical protein ACU639_05230 [Streptomyces cynarae]|uniref:hypothetical protein n=1 Tax=Streptomyces cynarae TaxID=2981134 RepID=UPI00406D2EFC